MSDESTFDPELADIEAMLRDLTPGDLELVAPADTVWAGIETELADDPVASAGSSNRRTANDNVVPLRRRWIAPALAAAAVLIVAIGAVAIVATRGSGPETLATAELAFDPAVFDPAGAGAAATASLLAEDGDDVLEIDDDELPFTAEQDASLELWMIRVDDGEIVDMVSLGDIEPDGRRDFAVPAGYDPAVYSVVDISIEPHDGDPTHSGRSILRGVLAPSRAVA